MNFLDETDQGDGSLLVRKLVPPPDPYWIGQEKRHKPLHRVPTEVERLIDNLCPVVQPTSMRGSAAEVTARLIAESRQSRAKQRQEARLTHRLVTALERMLNHGRGFLSGKFSNLRSKLARKLGVTGLVLMLNPAQLPWLKITACLTALLTLVSATLLAWHP